MATSAKKVFGFSLMELLISMAVFAVFIFMIGDIVVTAYRAKGRTEEKVEARRQVSLVFAEIHRQLRTRALTCYPLDGSGSPPISPIAGAPFYIEYYRPDGLLNKVNYYYDATREAVIRTEIAPPATTPEAKIVVRHAKSFTVNWDSAQKLSTLSIRVSTITQPLSTQIYYYLPAFNQFELATSGGTYE